MVPAESKRRFFGRSGVGSVFWKIVFSGFVPLRGTQVLPQNDNDKDSSVALALEAFSGKLSFQALFHFAQVLPQNDHDEDSSVAPALEAFPE
jgi:hypothetical protein